MFPSARLTEVLLGEREVASVGAELDGPDGSVEPVSVHHGHGSHADQQRLAAWGTATGQSGSQRVSRDHSRSIGVTAG